LRIAIVINTSWNIFNFRKSLVNALLQEGHEVIAIAPEDSYSKKLQELGMEFYPVKINNKGSNPFQELLQIRRFHKVYKKANIDIALQYTIKPNIYGTLAAKMLRIPVICNVSGLGTVFIRENLVSKFAHRLYKYAFQFPKTVFFQNPDDKQEFLKRDLVKEAITDLLPGSGITLDEYTPTPLPLEGPLNFIFIARLIFDKGIVEFLTAAERIKKKYDVEFTICGKIETQANLGITEQALQPFIDNKTIKYLGHIDDVATQIQKSHCVVLPSYREGTPRSLIEAAALERPIITTNVPGCKEVVVDKENGFLCLEESSDDLEKKIIQFIELDSNKRSEMALASRKLAETKFDDKFVIQKYFEKIAQIQL